MDSFITPGSENFRFKCTESKKCLDEFSNSEGSAIFRTILVTEAREEYRLFFRSVTAFWCTKTGAQILIDQLKIWYFILFNNYLMDLNNKLQV